VLQPCRFRLGPLNLGRQRFLSAKKAVAPCRIGVLPASLVSRAMLDASPSQEYHGYDSNVRVVPALQSGLQGSTTTTVGMADKYLTPGLSDYISIPLPCIQVFDPYPIRLSVYRKQHQQ
jgi:hypothetical protein